MPDAFGNLTAADLAGNQFFPNYGSGISWGPTQGYDPTQGGQAIQAQQLYQTGQYQNAQLAASSAYQQGMLQYYNDQLAFQKAQQAFTDYMSMGSQYGYAPGVGGSSTGNMFGWPANPTPPMQAGYHSDSSGLFQPTGYAGMPTMQQAQQTYGQLQGQAQNTAAATGNWQQPIPAQWAQQMPTWDQIQSYMQSVNPSWDADKAKAYVTQLVNETPDTFHGNYPLTQLSQAALQNIIQSGGGMPSQQTLQSQQQEASIAAQQAGLTGYYNAPSMYTPGSFVQDPSTGGYYQVQSNGQLTPYSGTPTGQVQQGSAGMGATTGQQGTPTLALQQFQQQSAMQYLQLLSQLQGPADYGQYLKVLGSTPGGIQDLVGAAAGKFVPGTGVSGTGPQQQTLQNLINTATGQGGGGTGANAATQTYGTDQSQTGGAASPGGMNYQDYMAQAQGLPPPSQIAPQSFNAMAPSQKQMLGGMYANLGYSPGDINAMYTQSLPKYAAGSAAGNFRLV